MNNGTMSYLLLFVVIIGIMWWTMSRQSKQQKKHQEMVNGLKVGDEVVTIGRLHGIIDSVDTENKTVTLDCDGVYLVFDSVAIARVAGHKTTEAAASKQVESSASENASADQEAASDKEEAQDQPAADKADDSKDKDAEN